MTTKVDRILMSGVKKGQPESFDQLYELYKLPIFNFIYQMTGDIEDAKDLAQESFLAIYQVLTQKKKVENLKAYLYTIARNKALLRIQHRSREYIDDEFILQVPDESYYSDPARVARNRKQQSDIVKTLQMMPERHREVLVLREQAGFSYDKIASMLETNKTNVGVLLYRARAKFRELYRMLQVTEKPASEECERTLPLISSWLDGETTRKQEQELQKHMADCPFCRLASEQMVDANRVYHSFIPLMVPLSVKAGIMAKAGLAGAIPTSLAASAVAGSAGAGGGASIAAGGAAVSSSAGSSSAAAGAGVGAAAAAAGAGLSAKAVGLMVAAAIAVTAAGGGTYIGVKKALEKKPAAVVQMLKEELQEFLKGARNRVDIPAELRQRSADIWQAAEQFFKEYLPDSQYQQLKIAEQEKRNTLVRVLGLVSDQNKVMMPPGDITQPQPLDCYLEIKKQEGYYQVEKMTKEKQEP